MFSSKLHTNRGKIKTQLDTYSFLPLSMYALKFVCVYKN